MQASGRGVFQQGSNARSVRTLRVSVAAGADAGTILTTLLSPPADKEKRDSGRDGDDGRRPRKRKRTEWAEGEGYVVKDDAVVQIGGNCVQVSDVVILVGTRAA